MDRGAQVAKESQISGEANQSSGALEQLGEAIEELYQRLQPILNLEEKTANTEEPPEQTLCQIAETFRRQRHMAERCICAIRDMKIRIEL